jgi:hypothetical protein
VKPDDARERIWLSPTEVFARRSSRVSCWLLRYTLHFFRLRPHITILEAEEIYAIRANYPLLLGNQASTQILGLCGGFPHHPPPQQSFCFWLVAEACEELNVAVGACSLRSCRRRLWCGWRNRGWIFFGSCVPAAGLVQCAGRLIPVGRHGDSLAAHTELHRRLSPPRGPNRGRCKGAPGPDELRPGRDLRDAILEVLVHERCCGVVPRCWDWSQAGHALAELRDWVRCFHWVSSSPGILSGSL